MTLLTRITEIEARAAAATAGPWIVNGIGMEIANFGADDERNKWTLNLPPTSAAVEGSKPAKHDAVFSSHARQDVPELCAKLRRAVDLLVAANTLLGESRSILEAERPDVMHAISAFLSGEGER